MCRRGVLTFQLYFSIEGLDDAHEAVCLEGCTTDKATVYVRFCEKLPRVGGLAASAVKNRRVVGKLLTVFLSNHAADMGMHVLSLLGCGGLACADGPYRLISYYYLCEISRLQAEESLYLALVSLWPSITWSAPVDLTIAALTSPV